MKASGKPLNETFCRMKYPPNGTGETQARASAMTQCTRAKALAVAHGPGVRVFLCINTVVKRHKRMQRRSRTTRDWAIKVHHGRSVLARMDPAARPAGRPRLLRLHSRENERLWRRALTSGRTYDQCEAYLNRHPILQIATELVAQLR